MKLAIMQPYLFPYIGYYQLIDAVDKFVNYDDVTYIKKGWINRNNIQSHGEKYMFSIPINDISSFRPINITEINNRLYIVWRKKFLKTLHLNYCKSPFFEEGIRIVESVLDTTGSYISSIAFESIKQVCNYLKIETKLIETSEVYNNAQLSGKDRVIDICKREEAEIYINPIGGQDLYDKYEFIQKGIKLYFLESNVINYNQMNKEFIPNLSIIDVIMYNHPHKIQEYLKEYSLI